jgi:hypothetical protein
MTQLTSDQLVKVKEKFCLNLVDNMDLDTLIEIVHEQLMQGYDDFDQEEMKEEDDKIVNTVTNTPYSSYGDYVTTNPETLTDYGVGK